MKPAIRKMNPLPPRSTIPSSPVEFVELIGRRDVTGDVPTAKLVPIGDRVDVELTPRGDNSRIAAEIVDDLQIVRRLIAKHGAKQLHEMVEAATSTTQS